MQPSSKSQMDLGTVKKNLGSKPSRCRFKTHEKFVKDVRLVFQNAMIYNEGDKNLPGSVYDAAKRLSDVFEAAYAKSKVEVFDKVPKTSTTPSSSPPPVAAPDAGTDSAST